MSAAAEMASEEHENEFLSGEASASSALSMLKLDEPKVVEVKEGSYDLDDAEEPSLMDELYADAAEAKAEKDDQKAIEAKRMKKTFGHGLKKGFFKAEKEDKPKKKKKKMPTIRKQEAKGAAEKISEEVRMKMRDEIKLNEEKKKEWLNTELLEEMMKRPRLAKGFQNPKYAAAIASLQKEPGKYKNMMYEDNELREFVNEFCEVMGNHFTGLGDKELKKREESRILHDLGPLAAQIHRDHKDGKGPMPPQTPEEQNDVDAVLNNPDLKKLLTDPETQKLMQRCGDPKQFHLAMRDPNDRAKLETLAKHGLVQLV